MLAAKVIIVYSDKPAHQFEQALNHSEVFDKGVEVVAQELVESIQYLDDEHCDSTKVLFMKDKKEIALVTNGRLEWDVDHGYY